MSHWILIACLLVTTWCNAALAVELPLRTWSDRTGRFSVEARLFVQQDEFVTLDAADGRRLDVPLATLSEADQQYLAALVAEQSAPQYGARRRLTARLGVEVTARDGACRNLMCAFPIPLDWPEQSVTIVDREVSSNVRKVNVHTLGGGVQQVRFLVPRLAAGEVARVVFVLDIERSSILTPRDLSRLRIPTVVDARLRQYVRESPQIEIRHPVVRAEADRLAWDAQTPAWQQVLAIRDHTFERVEYTGVRALKGAMRAIEERTGDCEERTSVFVALCRLKGIPARSVWIPGHAYAEFYLEDASGSGHWFPCESIVDQFGTIGDHFIILQKGDNFRDPLKPELQRYISETARGTDGVAPLLTPVREINARQEP